jgi:hypothetical protein
MIAPHEQVTSFVSLEILLAIALPSPRDTDLVQFDLEVREPILTVLVVRLQRQDNLWHEVTFRTRHKPRRIASAFCF